MLEAVRTESFGTVLHPTLEEKACELAFSIIQGHVFMDGNKRTGVEVLFLVLELNGKTLVASDDDIVETMEGIADGSIGKEQFLEWIKDRSR